MNKKELIVTVLCIAVGKDITATFKLFTQVAFSCFKL